MKPKNISGNENLFRQHRSYSPEEILAAGGTTAFGIKSGKTMDKLVKALEALPPAEPFTDEEWANLLEQMANDK